MHVEVHPDTSSKPSLSSRLPSLAGRGLPERMRSTIVAFMGLTAAAGLALVAIFAQMGFPLLSPAPLPDRSAGEGAVGGSVALERGTPAVGLARARDVIATSRPTERNLPSGGPAERAVGVGDPSAPVSGPEPRQEGEATDPAPAPSPAPPPDSTTPATPEPVPAPAPAPASVPAVPAESKPKPASSKPSKSQPKPVKSKPAKPEAKPAKSEEKAPKPEAQPAPQPAEAPAPPLPATVEKKEKEQGKYGK